jgi:hypothetical protein
MTQTLWEMYTVERYSQLAKVNEEYQSVNPDGFGRHNRVLDELSDFKR